jgi:hypothetical protein
MAVWITLQPSAPAQSTRLYTLQPLVSREPDGVPAGEPARLMAVPRNTLSAHLAAAIALDANLPSYQAVSAISGQIEWSGSDTLNTETALWAKRFEGPFPGVTIEIESIGSVVMRSSQNEGDGRLDADNIGTVWRATRSCHRLWRAGTSRQRGNLNLNKRLILPGDLRIERTDDG